MGIVSWIILGLIAGFIGSKIVNRQGQGFWLYIALGIVGALVGVTGTLLLWSIRTYNSLVIFRTRADMSWSQINVQLKQRYDLIPRLVEVLQWHKYRDLDPGSMWLRDIIIDGARKLPSLDELDGANAARGESHHCDGSDEYCRPGRSSAVDWRR